ncbi:hypothetical protein N7492_005212 [Penicillium capsulatum]|uniref:Uncharacterized protein n=1 Tax=Penicillium capsulatum TaxID=69766 RepID=A0A9W9I8Z3_9EURO|nr:hypothetical protein N7492_005212 [Penicillium capsulatum]KAJ6135683.1 hypothetical protein N7512_000843 [Penicillium capsulatum]
MTHLTKTTQTFFGGDIITEWLGRGGPGVLSVEDVRRDRSAHGPYISELSIAAYKRSFSLDSLKYVFVTYIKNTATRLVLNNLCPKDEVTVLEFGTPEYQTLLGTPIGKIVAHLMLGAFDRGSGRISKVTIWWSGPRQNHAQAQFDIMSIRQREPISGQSLPVLEIEPRNSRQLRIDTKLQSLSKVVISLSVAYVLAILIDRYFELGLPAFFIS